MAGTAVMSRQLMQELTNLQRSRASERTKTEQREASTNTRLERERNEKYASVERTNSTLTLEDAKHLTACWVHNSCSWDASLCALRGCAERVPMALRTELFDELKARVLPPQQTAGCRPGEDLRIFSCVFFFSGSGLLLRFNHCLLKIFEIMGWRS